MIEVPSPEAAATERLAAAVEDGFEAEVQFLRRLVQTRSEIPPADFGAISEAAADSLEALGFTVERHAVPEPFARQHGLKSVVNLIVRHRFGSGVGPVVALQAHGDTVPAGSGWSLDPFAGEVLRGALWGRGAAVSKSDIAAYAFALDALRRTGEGLSGTVELHITFDEEAGGHVGPQWLLAQGLTRPDLVIAAGFTHAVTVVHAGCLHLEIVIRGRAAHAALPEEGADALEAATPVLAALYGERRRLAGIVSAEPGIGSARLTVGTVSSGISINVVPDRTVIRVDRRLIPEEDGEAVEADLIRLIEAAAGDRAGIEVECRRLMLAEPLRPRPGVEDLVALIRRKAEAVLGRPIEATGAPLYSDGRHYAAAGIPTVLYGAGPRSVTASGAYGPDERLDLADLKAATLIVAGTLADLLRPR
ncbi:M20/M25/M40 family metallo-hydrolase [Prosthecomicrobium sp. N25]|uniref:M20/M25/M40 family metallo-hydrolase n=1 Tax=Prosthecomicrobium sp. N25 TaxID=3129254 RepID=UPI003077AAFC